MERTINMRVLGTSVAGEGTTLVVPELKMVFDCGAKVNEAVAYRNVLITHGHVDHVSWAPVHAATRELRGMSPSRFFVPRPLAESFRAMMDAVGALNGTPVPYDVEETEAWVPVQVTSKRFAVPFTTYHRDYSLGYAVYEDRNKLKEEYTGMSPDEIGSLARSGVTVTDRTEHLVFAYVGDSTVAALDNNLGILKADTLVLECTYLEDVSVVTANMRGHTQMSELRDREGQLGWAKNLYLTHFSPRYSETEVQEALGSLRREVLMVGG